MNFFKKEVIEFIGYVFFSFVIVIIAAFFFVSSCLATENIYNFDAQSVGEGPIGVNLRYTGFPNIQISDTQSYSSPNSLRFYSNIGTLFHTATSTQVNRVAGQFFISQTSATFITAFNATASSTNQGALFIQYSDANNSVITIRSQNSGTFETFGTVAKNTWHSFLIIFNTNSVEWYVNENLITTTLLYDPIIDIVQFSNGTFNQGYSYLDNLLIQYGDPLEVDNTTSLVNYDFQLSEVEPDFGTVANQICFLGVECRLYFSFNQLAIGYPMYLFNYEDSNFPGNEIASTTVTATPIWQNYVIVPDQATSTELKYNFLLDAGEYGWIVKTGIKINWWSEAEWQAYLDDIGPEIDEYCSAENVCENVATSSDFLYGVQCGFQQGICWMLVPNSGSKNFFFNTVTKFESSFPFNFYFTIVNQAKSNFQKSASSDASLDFPMYSTSTGEVSWQPLISSSTVTDVWNDDTYDLTNNIFTLAWWLLVIFAITYLVYRQMI